MSKHLLIIQQSVNKIPGNILATAARHNVKLRVIKLWYKHTAIPSSLKKYDGLVVLDSAVSPSTGGCTRKNRVDAVMLKSFAEDRPYLGIGSGSHLMAASQGAVIGDNCPHDIGFITGCLTRKGREHPIFQNLPNKFLLFKWHRQVVMPPMPADIDILAASVSCQFEAISIVGRPHIVGLQFLNNAAALQDVKKYVTKDKKWLSARDEAALPIILDEAARLGNIAANHFTAIFTNFINML